MVLYLIAFDWSFGRPIFRQTQIMSINLEWFGGWREKSEFLHFVCRAL